MIYILVMFITVGSADIFNNDFPVPMKRSWTYDVIKSDESLRTVNMAMNKQRIYSHVPWDILYTYHPVQHPTIGRIAIINK